MSNENANQPVDDVKYYPNSEEEIIALRRYSSLYEQAANDRDKYKALILKAFEYASPLSKNGKIYKLRLTMFEKENNIIL